MVRPHQNLDAWQQAMRLVKMLISSELGYLAPQHEVFAQLERVGQLLSGLHKNVTR